MILALMLAAGAPQTVVDAERAFAAAAQTEGQWTAFRHYAASDAVMFTPQPVNAQSFLAKLKNPPKAIMWWPTASFISCDGAMAANTGGWRRPDGSVGYFSTIWVKQPDGSWKWIVDGGDSLKIARAQVSKPIVKRAPCHKGLWVTSILSERDGRSNMGASPDGTISWHWHVAEDGSRRFGVEQWNGKDFHTVIDDRIAAE